jgi:mono/diheme cytochrome c family protein
MSQRPLASKLAMVTLMAAALGGGVFVMRTLTPSEGESPDIKNSAAEGPALIALGQGVYRKHCASCHGRNLEGEPNWRRRKANGKLPAPPHDASGHTWHHGDKLLFRIVKRGTAAIAPAGYKTDMPGYAGVLTDREIRAVLAFIKSRWPLEIRRKQAAMGRR